MAHTKIAVVDRATTYRLYDAHTISASAKWQAATRRSQDSGERLTQPPTKCSRVPHQARRLIKIKFPASQPSIQLHRIPRGVGLVNVGVQAPGEFIAQVELLVPGSSILTCRVQEADDGIVVVGNRHWTGDEDDIVEAGPSVVALGIEARVKRVVGS